MDAYFKDTEGNYITFISNENLSEFKKFLANTDYSDSINFILPHNEKNRFVQFAPELTFDDITKDESGQKIAFNENAQEYLGGIIRQSEKNRKLVLSAMDEAEFYPGIITYIYDYAGSRSINGGGLYDFINEEMAKRSLAENLPLIDAFVSKSRNYNSYFNYGNGKVALNGFSGNQKKHLEHIYRLGKQYDINSRAPQTNFYMAAEAFKRIAKEDAFVNCNMPSDMRADFNKIYLSFVYETDGIHKFALLDEKYFSVEDVAKVVSSGVYRNLPKTNQDTSKAHTQAEKNVNILPEHYKKIRNLILKQAEKEPAYIPGTKGETKTMTEKVKSLALKYYNVDYEDKKARGCYVTKVDKWKDLPMDYKSGIMQDVLIRAAYRDIVDGNAAKLDKDILQNALNLDKDGYYAAMLSDEVVREVNLSKKQSDKRLLTKTEVGNLNVVNYSKNLSVKKKTAIIENTKKAYAEELARKSQLEQFEREYNAIFDDSKRLSIEIEKLNREAKIVSDLQGGYQNIVKNLKDGQPNKNETFLQKKELENIIGERLNGREVYVRQPEEGMLPLFGRGAEKERREALRLSISQFNESLRDLNYYNIEDLKPYSGSVLEEKTAEQIRKANADKKQEADTLTKEFYEKYNGRRDELKELDGIRRIEKVIDESAEMNKKHAVSVRKKAKENIGVPEKSPLQAVQKNMSKEEKSTIRRNNKLVLDKLANRASAENEGM